MRITQLSFAMKVRLFALHHAVTILYSLFTSKHSNRILMFHSIEHRKTNLNEFVCNVEDFKRYITYVKNNHSLVSIYDVLRNSKHDSIAVSFDDGYEGVYLYAFPLLKEMKIPFTVFVTTNYIDTPHYLTSAQIEEMAFSEFCTIGSHTTSHPALRFCDDLKSEIMGSKEKIESLIRKKIDLFAYPYGSILACSKKCIKMVKESGYKYAFSAIGLPINYISKQQSFFIPRINGDLAVLNYTANILRKK